MILSKKNIRLRAVSCLQGHSVCVIGVYRITTLKAIDPKDITCEQSRPFWRQEDLTDENRRVKYICWIMDCYRRLCGRHRLILQTMLDDSLFCDRE